MAKKKSIINVISIYFIFIFKGIVLNYVHFPIADNLLLIINTIIDLLLVLLFLKKDSRSFKDIRLSNFKITDIVYGIVLGLVISVLQFLPPMLLMGMDFSYFSSDLDFKYIIFNVIFFTLTVGISEEVIFRGYILKESKKIINKKFFVIALNCILFYAIHLTKQFAFDWTHLYSTAITTILCSAYLFLFPKRSLIAPIIAHGLYDTLVTGGTIFIILNKLAG